MQYDLELEYFDGRAWASARRDLPVTGTIHEAVQVAQKLFQDSAQEPEIPFVCRVVERDSGKLVAVVGVDRGSGEVLTTLHERYRRVH